jgi:hypothetical protein
MHGLPAAPAPHRKGELRLDDGVGHAVGKPETSGFDDDNVAGANGACCALESEISGHTRATRHYSCRRALCNDADEVTLSGENALSCSRHVHTVPTVYGRSGARLVSHCLMAPRGSERPRRKVRFARLFQRCVSDLGDFGPHARGGRLSLLGCLAGVISESLPGSNPYGALSASSCSRPPERSWSAWRSTWREVKPSTSDTSLANPPWRSDVKCIRYVTQPPGNRSYQIAVYSLLSCSIRLGPAPVGLSGCSCEP